MKRRLRVLGLGILGLLAMIVCAANLALSGGQGEHWKSRFAERAGQIWFKAEDVSADVYLGAAWRFGAFRARLFPGSQQPLSGPSGSAPPLTNVTQDDI